MSTSDTHNNQNSVTPSLILNGGAGEVRAHSAFEEHSSAPDKAGSSVQVMGMYGAVTFKPPQARF